MFLFVRSFKRNTIFSFKMLISEVEQKESVNDSRRFELRYVRD